jgi:hypothetical protein
MGFFTARTGQAQAPYEAPPEKKIIASQLQFIGNELLEIKNILNGMKSNSGVWIFF